MRGVGAGKRIDHVERLLAAEEVGHLVAQALERVLGKLLVAVPPDALLGGGLADDELVLRRAARVLARVDGQRARLRRSAPRPAGSRARREPASTGFQTTLPVGWMPWAERSTRPRMSMVVIGATPSPCLPIVCPMAELLLTDGVVTLRTWQKADAAELVAVHRRRSRDHDLARPGSAAVPDEGCARLHPRARRERVCRHRRGDRPRARLDRGPVQRGGRRGRDRLLAPRRRARARRDHARASGRLGVGVRARERRAAAVARRRREHRVAARAPRRRASRSKACCGACTGTRGSAPAGLGAVLAAAATSSLEAPLALSATGTGVERRLAPRAARRSRRTRARAQRRGRSSSVRRLVQHDRAERDRDDRVHVRVRRDLAERRVVEQPDVGGVADDRAEGDEVEEAEDRASRELREVRMRGREPDRQQDEAAGEHLVRRRGERVGGQRQSAREERSRRPEERRGRRRGAATRAARRRSAARAARARRSRR